MLLSSHSFIPLPFFSFQKVASDPVKRSKFVKSAWALANSNGFDGIDLDWEYPDAANKANFVSLIKVSSTSSY